MNAPRQTVKEKLHEYLTSNRLWPEEAEEILDSIEMDKTHYALNEVIHKQADGYPTQFFAAANMTVRFAALDWIDANKPRHYAQYMLDPNRMKREQS